MTDALRKMVEAMQTAMLEQALESTTKACIVNMIDGITVEVHGDFDLEKVARAGLEAIKPEMEDLLTGANREIFALILKEQP